MKFLLCAVTAPSNETLLENYRDAIIIIITGCVVGTEGDDWQ